MTLQTLESVLKVNYSTQVSHKHGQGRDLTQPPSSLTVTKTRMDRDYTCIMLILVTSMEASSWNFSGTSLNERRNRKLYQIDQLSGHLLHKPFMWAPSRALQNSSVLTQSLFLPAISINLTQLDLACNPNVMLAISEATSVSSIKCPRKWVPFKYTSSVPFFPTSSAPTLPYLCLSVDILKKIYFNMNF